MKLFTTRSTVLEELTWLKLWSILAGKVMHHTNVLIGSHLVNVTEGTIAEGSKARTKDESNVANDGILNIFVGTEDK